MNASIRKSLLRALTNNHLNTTGGRTSMLKSISTGVIGISAFMASTAFAVNFPCNPLTVQGTYIRQIPAAEVIDQLELHIDGTAAWYQSTAFDFLVTGGTFIREVGSWKCVSATRLVVTTIGMGYQPTQTPDAFPPNNLVTDEAKFAYLRHTHQFDVVSINTLNRTRRVFMEIKLSDNPLDPNVVPLSIQDTSVQALFQRVIPLTSDLP